MELIHKLEELEQERFEIVKEHIEEILYCRFTYEQLSVYLSTVAYNMTRHQIEDYIKDRERESKLTEEYSTVDYNFSLGINKDWGYFDVYYIKDRHGLLYITELAVSEE